MTIETNSMLGPGTLTIGAAGLGQLNASAQVRACEVEPSETVTRTEAKRVLSGETLAASESATYSYTLKATFIQDPSTGGLIDYTWDNAGVEKPFSFRPDSATAAKVEGTLRVVPIKFGGPVDDPSPESDVTFTIIGTPAFTPNV